MTRTCDTCTKCCDGTLSGEINGHKMYLGKPCHFLQIGIGCNIYKDRPQDPCKRYKCAWLSDENIPDFMKPEISNCILDYKDIDGIPYLRLSESSTPYTAEVLTWSINYALNNNLNIMWILNKKINYIGDKDFCNSVKKNFKL